MVGITEDTHRERLIKDGSLVIWALKLLILDISLAGLTSQFTKLEAAASELEKAFTTDETIPIVNAFLDELDSFGSDFHKEVKYHPLPALQEQEV